jgi:hypothetical protein
LQQILTLVGSSVSAFAAAISTTATAFERGAAPITLINGENAIDADPSLKKKIENLPLVVYATRAHTPTATHPEGVLIYVKTAEGNDSLAFIDRQGNSVTQSQLAILRMAQCHPDTPAIPRDEHQRNRI